MVGVGGGSQDYTFTISRISSACIISSTIHFITRHLVPHPSLPLISEITLISYGGGAALRLSQQVYHSFVTMFRHFFCCSIVLDKSRKVIL